MSDTEAAYIAGFVDGEGTICLHRQKAAGSVNFSYRVTFSITNTNRALLEWIRITLQAGLISTQARKNAAWKTCYQLCFRVHEQQRVIEQLLPYLRLKKAQAELILEFLKIEWSSSKAQPRKPDSVIIAEELIFEDLQALNRKGT